MRHTTLRRRLRRHGLATLTLILVGLASLTGYQTSSAAFSSARGAAGTFGTDTLNAPGPLTADRPCTPLAAGYRASTTGSGLGGSITLTTPATAAGDMLIMSVMTYDDGGAAPAGINTPPGWLYLGGNFADGASYDVRLAVFALAAPASPPADYTATFSTIAVAVGSLTSYRNAGGAVVSVSNNGTTATAAASSVTAQANDMLVTVFAHSGTTSSVPAGMTAGPAVNGIGAGLRSYHAPVAAAGGTGVRTSSINPTNPAWASIALAIPTTALNDPTVDLGWTATTDTYADGYEIVRTPGGTTTIAGRATVAWTDTTTAAGTGYTYTIAARAGTWRSPTRTVTVDPC
ncbi:hypothetical protein [Spirilliplanes yamanashiensis]|uniref:Fibronectin type-III domain-containing protein n=1 Tax=Spirilliplanes yamanashiensis TaxID=42233 RepID=A0A8J3Y6X2_9ACTN|nr:hypothetical protein [Spirilliplanes yamanashiensis]MDP9815005.1 hypothetical protein [Spirilliplanes yamanashiensis]GIJ02660.1 hypothetical protein Sya03_20120 [Spirilliplanes yamanashiensis]